MKELVLATSNQGKLEEFQAILSPIPCISQQGLGIETPAETGLTFIENAIIKARHASRMLNKPALADDSGLVVDALLGEPGIYSARFAGPAARDKDNIRLLLEKLDAVGDKPRQAYFYCALALLRHEHDPAPILATGICHGFIAKTPRGDNGFGYDPIFFLPTYHCTMAELPANIKNKISHRAMALNQLMRQLPTDPTQHENGVNFQDEKNEHDH